MGSLKLQSFEDYANASKIAATAKLEEEQKSAREDAAYEFKTLLAEFGVTSIKDLNEEDRNKFFRKLGASEISESTAIIEEGTRSQIGLINKKGKIKSVYMHYDGYPDHMLPTIKKSYMNSGAVKNILKKGGASYLKPKFSEIEFYGDKATLDGDVEKINKFIKDANYDGGAEFVYLFDERDGKWYMADVYAETGLQKAFESMIINEAFKPSKGNARDAKKVAKSLEKFFMDHPALAAPGIILGVCKYMLAESLTDANFHSYREPVSKVIKGKLSTIMVELDNLGGMSIPVGKKTIINLLDDKGAFMASAAGWSGIGIVEGMALFLDGFGHSDTAQKIVDAFELIWANESVMNEGNAFLAARAKAIEEDAEEFEFNGKKFPVIKEDINENLKSDIKTYQRQRKLGYNDQFHGDQSLSYTLSLDLGMNPDNEFGGGDWLGFDHVDLYVNGGKKEGTILDDALSGKYTYDDLKSAVAKFLGIKESEEVSEVEEGNAFGAARAEAIAKGEDKFKVGDEEYDVESVDANDKENAEEYAEEEGIKTENEEVEEVEEVTEAKFVKDFDKDVLDAETKADITTYYPSAKFFIGKLTHFFGELEPNLYFKAYYAKYYKMNTGNKIDGDFKITSIYSEKGSKYVNLYVESADTVEAPEVNEAEVKSDEDFKEYAFAVLGKAFGDKFDEEKAQEVVDGLLSKHGDDYGAAVGALTASLG